ncbi:hypothetical protein SOVF_051950 [Spinacia oleracea]|nr:hypothetical protein SOVF_051950 [Spinacia oleracea]
MFGDASEWNGRGEKKRNIDWEGMAKLLISYVARKGVYHSSLHFR